MVRRGIAAFLSLALGLGLEACDRCAGILGCTSDPRISFGGQLIVRETGTPMRGVALDFVRTGGVSLASDSVRTTTDADGRFQLAVEASDNGEVVGDLVVRASAPWSPYRVRDLRFRTSEVRGEGQVLGRVVVDPYIEFIGVLFDRRDGQLLAGARLTILRTGGVAVSAPDSVEMTLDADGRFLYDTRAAEPGEMIADLVVRAPSLPRVYRLSGVRFEATYLDRVPQVAAAWRIGAGLPYVGILYRRGSEIRSAGIEVEFRRTGGIAADPDTFSVSTNAYGAFSLETTPLADGVLVGDLIVRPPPPAVADTIRAIRLQTVDTEPQILVGVWGYGYGIFYGSQLWLRGTEQPAAGLEVEFRRTGGIAIAPDNIVAHTDSAGRFPLGAGADGAGDVVGDLTVRLPAPLPPTVIPGVRIATFASDEMRFLGYWGVGPSLRYLGLLLNADANVPIADAVVEFQRTSGIAVSPRVLTSTTIASGLFSLTLNPLDTGEVVGVLTIRPPAPFRDTTFTGIRLHTFDSDAQRLGGIWRLASPR
jgi:hypothetical protein